MKVKPLSKKQEKFLSRHNLKEKYEKAVHFFEQDYMHPSLHTEILEPKRLKLYSFRIDLKYCVVFIVTNGEAEIIAITNHYK